MFHFTHNNIYNVNETGMTTVQGKSSKVIAMRGRRQVGAITSAECGKLIAVEICMSATDAFIPPLFIFPRMRMKLKLIDEAPAGPISACLKFGWMLTDIFYHMVSTIY